MSEVRASWLSLTIPLIVAVALLCPSAECVTIRVSQSGPADYSTIQAAIDAAVDGDVVLVAPGTYTGDGNRDLDFKGKAITIKSENGPRTCIIDCQGSRYEWHRGFYFQNGERADSVLDGLTITGGYEFLDSGGGIVITRSSPTIRNCIIKGNIASGGGGLAVGDSDSLVSNCIIAGNRSSLMGMGGAGRDGGGIICGGQCSPVLRNCTIYGNDAGGYGGGIATGLGRLGRAVLSNCILFGNRASLGANQIVTGPTYTPAFPMELQVRYCLLEDEPNAIVGTTYSLYDCIRGDPLFVSLGYWDRKDTLSTADDIWVDGDYHLKSQAGRWDPNSEGWVEDGVTSPCIDTGDPNSSVGEEPEPNGGRVNMGAYGGTAEASKSPGGSIDPGYAGAGTAEDPYLIYMAQRLWDLAARPDEWDKHFKLMADIDLGGPASGAFPGLGTGAENPFAGVFDGNGHTIRGLVLRPPTAGGVGLFGYLRGTVRNLGLNDPNVDGAAGYHVGTLVGDNFGTVADCYAEEVHVALGPWQGGGLVGYNKGTVVNSHTTGAVHGSSSAGGLVGTNRGAIADCWSAAAVGGDDKVGGLVGDNGYGTIANCRAAGNILGDDVTGGLVGDNSSGTMASSYSTGVVVGNDGVGGLVGQNWLGVIVNCYSTASATGDRMTGGLVGDNGGAVTNCYAAGPVAGDRWPIAGLVSFRHDDTVTGSFWDVETTACSWSAGGTGLTTAEMQTALTFLAAGWDFAGETKNGTEDIWRILEGQDYPRLFWEPHGP
jgi:hypothetical protein